MDKICINNVCFFIDTIISLDKSCPIIKEKTNISLKQETKYIEQYEKLKKTINDLQSCFNVCKAINICFRKCYNISCLNFLFPNVTISDSVFVKINNIITKDTKVIFNIRDMDYLKRLIKQKTQVLNNYENRRFANNYTNEKKRCIQRKKLFNAEV